MPPRPLSLAIVLFWLGTTGYLFWRDLWPQFEPGQPPPFSIDLVEEAQTKRPYILWAVDQEGQRTLRARTSVEHPSSGVFELVANFRAREGGPPAIVSGCRLHRLQSRYRVTADGRLLGLQVQIEATPEVLAWTRLLQGEFTIDIQGEVEAGQLTPHLRVESPGGLTLKRDLPTAQVSGHGSVLLPMHPVNRIRGLSPGQRWRQPVLDPLGDSLGALQGGGGEVRFLRARVRPEREEHARGRREGVACLVVDYTGEGLEAETWVEEKTGLVLRQEVTVGGTHWAMYRE